MLWYSCRSNFGNTWMRCLSARVGSDVASTPPRMCLYLSAPSRPPYPHVSLIRWQQQSPTPPLLPPSSTQANHATSSLGSRSASPASSLTQRRQDASPLPAAVAAPADGGWAHVPGRLRSSPTEPRADTSTLDAGGARAIARRKLPPQRP